MNLGEQVTPRIITYNESNPSFFFSVIVFSSNPLSSVARLVATVRPLANASPSLPTKATVPIAAIDKVCRFAKDDKLCVNSLERDPDLVHADPKSLAFESIKVALSNATDISYRVKMLVTNMTADPLVQDGMSECNEEFVDVADQLDGCLEALMLGNSKSVDNWLRAAMAASKTCMASLNGIENTLLQKTQTFHLLCENALAINQAFFLKPSNLLA